ncbi:hypothetical protein JW835_03545 [bacterium]|nr:hypothetical protein [bacterium]RQV98218.1 MAG: hypothetical protein EH221_02280 [bacterium]
MKNRAIFIGLLFVAVHVFGFSHQNDAKLAWQTPAHIEAVLIELMLEVDPELPVPVLDHEKPFTRGLNNTVTWMDSMDAVYEQLLDMQMTIQFWAVEARIAGIDTVWGFVDGPERSAAFLNLPEGIGIEYRLRYYAIEASGTMHISDWSRAEISVQDASRPEILTFDILQLQNIGDNPWVLGPQIEVHVQAMDTDGQIMQIAIQEIGDEVDRVLFDDLDAHPRTVIDTTLQYTLLTDPNMPLTIKGWVVDVAEFYSDTLEMQFFYMASDPKVVCFPNPFVPYQDHCTVIKIENEEAQEAKIYDPFGNLIRILHKNSLSDMAFKWDGTNEQGHQVASGGYFCIINDDRDLYCKIAVIR